MKDKITITIFLFMGAWFAAKAARPDVWLDHLFYIPGGFAFVYCGVEYLLKAIEKRTAALQPGAALPAPGTGEASTSSS